MSLFNSISPEELAALSSIIAISLAKDKPADENNILGNLLAQTASTILTIAAQQQNLKSIEDKQKQIQDLYKQIEQLKSEL